MQSRQWFPIPVAALLWLCTAGPAQADLVVLTSGRVLSVKSHRTEGDSIVLQLRGGGEVTCDPALIASIGPDEVPFDEPEAPGEAPAAAPVPEPVLRPLVRANPYADLIASVSRAHGLDPVLVSAVIQVESDYRPGARSHKGAMGLMQLMPATARQYNVRNPYDPTANVAAGVKHLKALVDRWGVELALAAYNAGEGAVRKFNGIPPYSETRSYVARILALAGLR